MKKLNLKLGSIKEMLSNEQMKKVVGGADYTMGCLVIYTDPYMEIPFACPSVDHFPGNEDDNNCFFECFKVYSIDCHQCGWTGDYS